MTLWGRKNQEAAERERRLSEAEAEAAVIRERANKVATSLRQWLRRDPWSETITSIARRER